MPQETVPVIDKNKHSELVYQGDETDEWFLQVDGETLKTYTTNDLRVAIVYRARCFTSPAARQEFHDNGAGSTIGPDMTLDKILGKFVDDLKEKGKLTEETAKTISRLDLSLLIIETYIQYPLPDPSVSVLPYNVCALARLYPALKPALILFCK